MLKIEVRNNNVEKALRVLKKKLLKEGTLKLLKSKQYYEKPSEVKRRKAKEGRINMLKKQKMKKRLLGY